MILVLLLFHAASYCLPRDSRIMANLALLIRSFALVDFLLLPGTYFRPFFRFSYHFPIIRGIHIYW